jgi:hypothetical protein
MAQPFLTRKYLLLAKVEGTYGVDAVPVAATNAILVSNLKIKPDQEVIERKDVALPSLSKIPHLIGRRWVEITFDVELRGSSGSGATPPDFGALFRGCAMLETIEADPGGYVTYGPVSENLESVTIYAWRDAHLHKCVGCVGSWKWAGEVGKPAKFSFTFKGKLASITDQALAVPTYQNLKPPLMLGATASYGGWVAPLKKLELDLKNKITERPDVHEDTGIIGFFVSDREPEGKLDPEANTLATRDVWTNLWAVNEAALELVIGSGAGNQCTITAPRCAKKKVEEGNRDGIATYDLDIGLYQSSDNGDDELLLKFE